MVQPRQNVRFQNSYRLTSKNPFSQEKVEFLLKQVMDKQFSNVERFDSKLNVGFCRIVSDEIIEKIKAIKFDR